MNITKFLCIGWITGMTSYIIFNTFAKNNQNYKTLDISDKIIKYKKIQNRINEQCKNKSWGSKK